MKSAILLILCIALLAETCHATWVQVGSTPNTDGPAALQTGSGDRRSNFHITFPTPFTSIPSVVTSFWLIDADQPCVAVYPTSITTSGFDGVIWTWNDCRVWHYGVSWTATQTD